MQLQSGTHISGLWQEFKQLTDFFFVLTDSSPQFSPPRVSVVSSGEMVAAYFYGMRWPSTRLEFRVTDCPTMFNNIKNTLSHLHNKWNRKYKDYGSGFYLYTGTRLSGPIYVENAFINLTSGLEELHRRKHADRPIDKKLTAKIERILAQIEREADRRWALRFLNRAYDPSLNVRLNSLIASIGINFNMAGVQQFTERCRIIRNNIAHGASPELIQEAAEKNVVLGYLYHALILREIG
jgi:hypothetical protein